MEKVDEYRKKILSLLLAATDDDNNPRLTESTAKRLAAELTDQELSDGIDFNTPEEVADLLIDSGLEY